MLSRAINFGARLVSSGWRNGGRDNDDNDADESCAVEGGRAPHVLYRRIQAPAVRCGSPASFLSGSVGSAAPKPSIFFLLLRLRLLHFLLLLLLFKVAVKSARKQAAPM